MEENEYKPLESSEVPVEEEEEVLETSPGLRAEIDDNPEPELFEPTPENYSEYQPPYSGDYESENENHGGQ